MLDQLTIINYIRDNFILGSMIGFSLCFIFLSTVIFIYLKNKIFLYLVFILLNTVILRSEYLILMQKMGINYAIHFIEVVSLFSTELHKFIFIQILKCLKLDKLNSVIKIANKLLIFSTIILILCLLLKKNSVNIYVIKVIFFDLPFFILIFSLVLIKTKWRLDIVLFSIYYFLYFPYLAMHFSYFYFTINGNFFNSIHFHLLTFFRFIIISFIMAFYVIKLNRESIQILSDFTKAEQNNKEIEIRALVSEMNLLKEEMNTHFLFNCLNNVDYFIDFNKEMAKEILIDIVQIYNDFRDYSKNRMISINEEFKCVERYLKLEKLRLGKRLEFIAEIETELEDKFIVPLVVQTLVENSIKHGIAKFVEGGKIYLKITWNPQKKMFFLLIENPFKLENNCSQYVYGTRTGLSNIRRRLELIYGEKTDFNFEIKETGVASVSFYFSGLK